MNHSKGVGSLLVAVVALSCIGSGSARGALPTVLFLAGEKTPVTVEGSVTGAAEFKTAQNLAGKGVSVKFELPSSTSNLGPYIAEFKGVKEAGGSKSACSTTGDAAEVILLTGNETHLVFDTLSPVLGVAMLVLIATVLIDCNGGSLDWKVSGDWLASITPLNKEMFTAETFKLKLHCAAGRSTQEDIHYFNSSGVEQATKLIVELGGTKGNGCEEVAEEVSLKPSKMIEIMG